jgi:hypothetical protein
VWVLTVNLHVKFAAPPGTTTTFWRHKMHTLPENLNSPCAWTFAVRIITGARRRSCFPDGKRNKHGENNVRRVPPAKALKTLSSCAPRLPDCGTEASCRSNYSFTFSPPLPATPSQATTIKIRCGCYASPCVFSTRRSNSSSCTFF